MSFLSNIISEVDKKVPKNTKFLPFLSKCEISL